MRTRGRAGFTLIELLVVVAIIGILVAMGVVNYFNVISRAKQRRTMADLRGFSTAVEAYAADLARYPPAAAYSLPPGLGLPTATLASMRNYIAPTYIRTVPLLDGWNSWFTYGTTAARNDYVFRSNGQGGVPDDELAGGPTTNFAADIVLVNGQFVQWPEGVQR